MGRHRRSHSKHRSRHHGHPEKGLDVKKTFYKSHSFIHHHPMLSSVGAIVLCAILLRIAFDNTLFPQYQELKLWLIFIAIILGFAGLIAIRVWMANNVSSRNTQHNAKWRP